ncbi:MAG: V-type ATPase 116kDa subunit family protein [Candidatus Omnitrophota bacterium]|jgi:V/A-type H+-transporting ATPase subunit I
MELISIVVLKEKIEAITLRLLKLGIFHPVDIRRIEDELGELSVCDIDKEYDGWDGLEAGIRDNLRRLGISPALSRDIKAFSREDVQDILARLEKEAGPLFSRREELDSELQTKKSISSQLKAYPMFSLKRESVYSFLEVTLGKVAEKNITVLEKSLKDIPYVFYPFRKEGERVTALFIGLRRDRVFIDRVLKDISWEKIAFPEQVEGISKDVEAKLSGEIEVIRNKIEETTGEIKKTAAAYQEELSGAHSFIRLKKSLLEAKKYSCMTDKTVLLSGWVPREEKENAIKEIKKIDKECYIESKNAEEVNIPREEIPVKLRHAAFVKPFELLIDSYGIPRYGTIDPTIFTAISFLLMFGAMFGDIGHGLVLGLGSFLLRFSKNEKARQAFALMLYCGISSIIFGILYGSFFGIEFHSLWLKPIDNIMEIFKVSIIFGIVFMSLGILINIINALRDRDYLKVIFDKAGLVGGIIYWSAIGLFVKMSMSRTQGLNIYFIIISAGFALLFLKPFIEAVFKKEKHNIFTAVMESTIDILEVGMSYLANTVSFIRIAAFALAHTGLFIAIFELSRIVEASGGAFLSFLVVILGNILIILLEGLVVSIQSLRLNYYEFFSKFFMQGKETYKPVKL